MNYITDPKFAPTPPQITTAERYIIRTLRTTTAEPIDWIKLATTTDIIKVLPLTDHNGRH
jgi:hypothetical protein